MAENSIEKNLHFNSGINFSPDKGVTGTPPTPSEADKAKEMLEAFEKSKYKEQSGNVEVLMNKVESPLLIHAADELISKYEDEEFHNEGYKNDYAFMYILDSFYERVQNLKLTKDDLIELGIIDSGSYEKVADQADFEISGYSYKKEIKDTIQLSEIIERANGEVDKVFKNTQIPVEIVGSDDQRTILSSKLELLRGEMIARQDLTKMYGTIVRNTENLDGIVQELYYRLSMTPKAMDILFNAPSRPNTLLKTEGGIIYDKGKERGQARDAAVRCLEIVGCAENYNKLENLLKRPGIKLLFNIDEEDIDLLFIPEPNRGDKEINETLKKWIGDPSTWREANGKRRKEKDMKDEIRGLLTKRGNIFVGKGQEDIDYILGKIEDFVSSTPNQSIKREPLKREAKNVVLNAWRWFRVTGKATTYGYEYFFDETKGAILPFSDRGGVTSCDRIKVMYPEVFRAIYKRNKTETRDWGPDGSFGKYERFGVDYDKGLSFDTDYGKRTVDEIRWGYRKDGEKQEENANRYGDLKYNMLSVKIFNKYALGMYIAGRPDMGIFQYIMKDDWQAAEQFTSKDFWTEFAKHLGISITPEVVLDGKLRGFEDKEKIDNQVKVYKKRIFLAFWDGLRSLPQWNTWLARENIKLGKGLKAREIPSVDRIKKYILQTNILSKEEVDKLQTSYIGEE